MSLDTRSLTLMYLATRAISSALGAALREQPVRELGRLALGRSGPQKTRQGTFLVCTCLQALEIPQNRQRNLWKSLTKKGLDLEILGKEAWRKRDPTEGLEMLRTISASLRLLKTCSTAGVTRSAPWAGEPSAAPRGKRI